ncbi:secreted RxLR effector protein 161-like [Solanum dulcamara]|uniref:secreted RxLR effector protein 161-like n=1 Tax=Solanum dulcamara TaxID=45834 RepID=UPI002485AFE6|nr:secreted RxLR effector protein 161-like [Solanum dulcamara]
MAIPADFARHGELGKVCKLYKSLKYALELIAESGLKGAKPAGTPLEQNQKLTSVKYDELQVLSQYMHCPKESHMEAALRVVRYIKEAPGIGVLMPTKDTNQLQAYCDLDWGAYIETRRSVTGYLIKFGGALISRKSKKQETVSRSSAET